MKAAWHLAFGGGEGGERGYENISVRSRMSRRILNTAKYLLVWSRPMKSCVHNDDTMCVLGYREPRPELALYVSELMAFSDTHGTISWSQGASSALNLQYLLAIQLESRSVEKVAQRCR